ncbi:MAG: hypothetical protein J2P46_00455 [Zavarzinella sp.]|nr:hypothetical protein [Zavarzinella sp.]
MQLFRRFLVFQALLLWQGGFLFYSAVVISVGTDVVGSWTQGLITRHVTDWMNGIGAVAVLILAWDQISSRDTSGRRLRWWLWAVLAASLVGLIALHPVIERWIDGTRGGSEDWYAAFYFWHRVYLYVATVQWFAGLAYVAATLRAWSATRGPA